MGETVSQRVLRERREKVEWDRAKHQHRARTEDCNCCGEEAPYHPRLTSNGFFHCAACLGVEGIDPDTIEEGAFN